MSRKSKNKNPSSENTRDEFYNVGRDDTEQQLPQEVYEKVNTVHEMFKDWDKDLILHALKENNYDVEEVIRRRIDGEYQFTEVKKPKTKAEIREISRKKFRGGKTRGRGRQQRGGLKPQQQQPRERKVHQKKQVEKKEEKPTVEKTGGEVRTFQPVQENVNRTLSYSEVAAQRTAPVHVEEETQQKRKSKKKKDRKKKKALEQPVEQIHHEIEEEEELEELEELEEETQPSTTETLVQKPLPSMPSYPTQPQQRRKDSGGEVILPKTQNFDFDKISLQFGSLGISEQEKSRQQQLVQPTSNILGAQQPSQEQLKPSQNTQTEGWDNRYAQFNQPFQQQPNYYGYPEYTSEGPKQPTKKDAPQTPEEGKGTQTVPPNYKFMPPYTQYGQYYPSYPPYMMPNQFQYQGYPQKFPQGPFYGKQMYGYGNYPGYDEMDYSKYTQQQMYYMAQQPQQPTGQPSHEEKSQNEEQEGYEHGYGHEMYQMPYGGQYSSYMYQQQPVYPNQPYMQTPQGNQPKQPTTQSTKQKEKSWKQNLYE